MVKLTDIQQNILSTAAARDDGAAVVPAKMNKSAAIKIGSNFVAHKLMREVRSKPGMPIWREDDGGRSISLLITRSGREAIGVAASEDGAEQRARKAQAPNPRDGSRPTSDAIETKIVAPRRGSKKALLIVMLSAEKGATIDALIKATGWLPHTTRAALTGLRKAGYVVVRFKNGDDITAYKIANDVSVATEVAKAPRYRRRSADESAALLPTA